MVIVGICNVSLHHTFQTKLSATSGLLPNDQYNPNMLLYRSVQSVQCDELNLTCQGSIRFEYEDMVVIININKFGGGAAQFSAGLSPRKMICPDPFMGRLSDPNMHH